MPTDDTTGAATAGGHRLDPLFKPRSIALVGASVTAGGFGQALLDMARGGGFDGPIYPVNPRYADGTTGFFARLADLPETVDHVVPGVANARLESCLVEAVDHGARAVTARAAILTLPAARLLTGYRGKPPLALDSLATAAAHLSMLAVDGRYAIDELDVNPVLVTGHAAIAVDVLITPSRPAHRTGSDRDWSSAWSTRPGYCWPAWGRPRDRKAETELRATERRRTGGYQGAPGQPGVMPDRCKHRVP